LTDDVFVELGNYLFGGEVPHKSHILRRSVEWSDESAL
jgi:hypothetical protein